MLARLRSFCSRVDAIFSAPDSEFDQELETHLALLAERFAAQGMTREEASYAARRQLGRVAHVKEQRYEARGFPWIEAFFQDLRQSVRMLSKAPLFTATALAALTLGIGANTAVFSVVNAVLLKPLTAPHADRIVRFLNTYNLGSTAVAGFPEFNMWRQQATLFEDVSAHRIDMVNLTGGAYPEQIPLARVSEGFFRLFGAPVLHGRLFTPEEDRPGGSRVAVLSFGLWTRRFGGDPEVVGKSVMLGSDAYTVIGVLSSHFDTEQFDPLPEAWVPMQVDPNTAERGSYCTLTGRLKPGVTLPAANAELQSLAEEYRGMLAGGNPTATFTVEPLQEAMGADVRSSMMLLLGAVGFVLLIACANVANLLLVRATGRRREMAIRSAVGASRGRIVRQLLTESIGLSLAGGALGLAVGMAGIRAILGLYSGAIPRLGAHGASVGIDWRVVVFTILVSLATGVLFGLAPAVEASRSNLTQALKESSGRSGAGLRQNRARALLVISEVALAAVLLVGAALLIRSFVMLRSVNPGFDTHHVLTTQVSLAQTRFERTGEMERLVRQGVEGIHAQPQVAAASAACCVPLETVWQLSLIIEGRPLYGRPMHGMAGWTFISPEYFDTFQIPVLHGRAFTERDRTGGPGVVIINQALAGRFWPTSDPIGQHLIIGRNVRPEYEKDAPREIVGIVGDVRDTGLGNNPRPAMYVPIAQLPDEVNAINLRLLPMAWFVRVRGESPALSAAIQNQLRQASGGLPAASVRSMDEVAVRSTAGREFNMSLMTIFGGMALLLAVIGIYGLMAHAVEQRTQEIGIRMALGAGRGEVLNMLVFQGMRLALIGVAT